MAIKTLAHVSDLHLGKNVETERRAIGIRDALLAADVDHVIITGDLTHKGRHGELSLFWRIFSCFRDQNRLTIIPGNHDCLGDDVSEVIQDGPRVTVAHAPGLHLVRFNSTGPHNRSWLNGQGAMSAEDIQAIERAASSAARGDVVALLLHHHVLPLPADHPAERLSEWFGWPYAEELQKGTALVAALRGRCDLILHGHRHTPRSSTFFQEETRPLSIFNAGSSTELGKVRVFCHDEGALMSEPGWLETWTAPTQQPERRPARPAKPLSFAL